MTSDACATLVPAAWPSLPAPRASWTPAPSAPSSDDVATVRPPADLQALADAYALESYRMDDDAIIACDFLAGLDIAPAAVSDDDRAAILQGLERGSAAAREELTCDHCEGRHEYWSHGSRRYAECPFCDAESPWLGGPLRVVWAHEDVAGGGR